MPRNRNWTLEDQLLGSRRKVGTCWRWTGPVTDGYGVLKYNWRTMRAHRVSAILYLGLSWKDSLHVLHKCGNRDCFNPRHLYLGTPAQNIQDSIKAGTHYSCLQKRKTHCPQGHAYKGSNLMLDKKGRRCRICHNSWRARAAEKALTFALGTGVSALPDDKDIE